jgi:hypothetical protein
MNAFRLRRVMRGIQRSGGASRPAGLPITSEVLEAILLSLNTSHVSHDSLMFGQRAVSSFLFLYVLVSLLCHLRSTLPLICLWPILPA